jgi:hypothetical protein
MNERIKELIKEAGEVYQEDVWSGVGVYEFNKEKFAELIVRECAGVCDDERDSNDSEFGKLVAEICALKIMERFGVEE